MLNSHRSKFSRAMLYTSILTVCHTVTAQAMKEEDRNNKYTISGPKGKKHQVEVTPQKTTISNFSLEDFSEMMSGICLDRGFQFKRPEQTHQDALTIDLDQNPFHAKGQAVIDILESLRFKNAQKGTTYEKAKAKQFNDTLKQDISEANAKFLNLLKQKNFSQETVSHLSELTYGIQKLEDNYFTSMIFNLEEENIAINQKKLKEDGYASEYINPKNKAARRRFIEDALDIFEIRKETSEIITGQMAKSRFKDFHSFIKIYLGLVRDTTGGLFSRGMALNLTSTNPTVNGLGEEDMKARKKVISLHYLGTTERTFQMIDELQPLAEIAYDVGHKYFNREMIEDQLSFARNALNEFFFQEHGIGSGEEVREAIPTDFPLKPLSQGEKRKIQERENEEKIGNIIREQQAEKQEKEKEQKKAPKINSSSAKIKSLPLIQEKEKSDETYREWFYRTQLPDTSKNLKSAYRTPTVEQLNQKNKTEIKNSKKEKNFINNNNNVNKVSKVVEKEEIQIKENIKSVIHAPHKNGSKKLRPEHIKNVRTILLESGYTSENALGLDVGGGPRKVFQKILNLTFSGEMNEVINMIRALKGHVDETRSGSRVGIFLRHITTNVVVGTDLLSPGGDD